MGILERGIKAWWGSSTFEDVGSRMGMMQSGQDPGWWGRPALGTSWSSWSLMDPCRWQDCTPHRGLWGRQVWGCRTPPGGKGPLLGFPVSEVLSLGVQELLLGDQEPFLGCKFQGYQVQDPFPGCWLPPTCPGERAPSGPGADGCPVGAGSQGAVGATQAVLPSEAEQREEPAVASPAWLLG